MKKIQFDSGIQEYRIGSGGVLRFNPQDPNLYARFSKAADKIAAVEQELSQQAKNIAGQDNGLTLVNLLQDADRKMKEVLGWVFGDGNDFDQILGGVNLLAVAENGERVVTNLFGALEPVMIAGAKRCAGEQARLAKENL